MQWTWDRDKDNQNVQKHGITFEIAQLVFSDPFTITEEDPYPYEQRWKTTGMVRQTVLIVIHTVPEDAGGTARIISARKATRHERTEYEEGYAETN